MEEMFYAMLYAGFHGSIVILAVLLLRTILRQTPRKFICILWILAFVRLVIPFSFQSSFSMQPATPQEITIEGELPHSLKENENRDASVDVEILDQDDRVFPEEPVSPVVIQKQFHWDQILQTIWFMGARSESVV